MSRWHPLSRAHFSNFDAWDDYVAEVNDQLSDDENQGYDRLEERDHDIGVDAALDGAP